MPRDASSMASVNPTGPAPTMRTVVSTLSVMLPFQFSLPCPDASTAAPADVPRPDDHRLVFGVLVQRMQRPVAAEARFLEAAERHLDRRAADAVDDDRSRKEDRKSTRLNSSH